MEPLKYEYGVELTWGVEPNQGLNTKTIQQIIEAFPLDEPPPEPEPSPVPAPQETLYQTALAAFKRNGLKDTSAKRAATKIAAQAAMIEIGMLNSSDLSYNERRRLGWVQRNSPSIQDPDNNITMLTSRLIKAWAKWGYQTSRGGIKIGGSGGEEYEINCYVMSKWEELEKFWEYCDTGMKALGYTRQTDASTSGGGHLHVSKPEGKFNGYAVHWVTHWLAAHPYIQWGFNDPNDNNNAYSPISKVVGIISNLEHEPNILERDLYYAYEGSKGRALCLRNKGHSHTLEFRLFEAPETWEEQVLHVQFCERLISKAEMLVATGKHYTQLEQFPVYLPGGIVTGYPKWGDALKASLTAINKLGLNPTLYKKIFARNIEQRYSYGNPLLLT